MWYDAGNMELKTLQDKKLAIEATFNDLTKQRQEYSDKSNEIDTEIIRLQGEYRLIDELIAKLGEKKNAK